MENVIMLDGGPFQLPPGVTVGQIEDACGERGSRSFDYVCIQQEVVRRTVAAFASPQSSGASCNGLTGFESMACYADSAARATTGETQRFNQHLADIYGALGIRAYGAEDGYARRVEDYLTEEQARHAAIQEALWRTDREARREAQGSTQRTIDNVSLTSWLEVEYAMNTIWKDQATYYDEGPICGTHMECFVGADFEFGAITIGHTILTNRDVMPDWLQVHEYSHVRDVEELGSVGFYLLYGAGWVASGFDYRQNVFEQTAYNDQQVFVNTP